MYNGLDIAQRVALLQLSNDMSRSPIPIEPEDLKSMNMCLPPNIDASNNDLLKSSANSSTIQRARDLSPAHNSSMLSVSDKVVELNADMAHFT